MCDAKQTNPLTLQVGKTYLDRTGKRWTIQHVTAHGVYWPGPSGGPVAWYEDGRGNFMFEKPTDLIAEAPAAEPTLVAAYCNPEGKPFPASTISPTGQPYVVEHMSDGQWWLTDVVDGKPGARRDYTTMSGHSPSPGWKPWTWPKDQPAKAADIPHRDILDALLHGKTVQYWAEGPRAWNTLANDAWGMRFVLCSPGYKYRVKPEPIVQWCAVTEAGETWGSTRSRASAAMTRNPVKLLRLELDPDTFEFISGRTEAP